MEIKKLIDSFNLICKQENYFKTFCLTFDIPQDGYLEDLQGLLNKVNTALTNDHHLHSWHLLCQTLLSLEEYHVGDYIDKALDLNVMLNELLPTFKKLYYTQWFYHIVALAPSLSHFSAQGQNRAVSIFKTADLAALAIDRAKIIMKLTAARPNTTLPSPGSAVALLKREAAKSRRHKPVRVLLDEIPSLIQTIKPCFLMSPLSVSTYLASDKVHFDVVIFDEASQIFPWDAIGSIYRAKQLIVVGDSKQMPPSDFFMSGLKDNEDEEDFNEDEASDFESILDLAKAHFQELSLQWHYRSQIEDLIAFSNNKFYNHSLVTFKEAKRTREDAGVEFYHVPAGTFDRVKKNNTKEASKVVELVFSHFKNNPKKSLGVVAFSVTQQMEIEELINKEREKSDPYAAFFDETLDEPFFVKNLETIQGDERDTIIFSVGYGKDSTGRFLQNFGPLNRKGGERRLNVAITRAKYNVKLVASFLSYDIDLSKTSSLGVAMLKEYLEFAKNGTLNKLETTNTSKPKETQDDFTFIDGVVEVLQKAGYQVDTHIGSSDYQIDIGVRHPTIKGVYVLAIESDGEIYHKAKTVRDRDRLRSEVLGRLGWNYYRVWSQDFVNNHVVEKERLLEAVKHAIATYDHQQALLVRPLVDKTSIASPSNVENVEKQYLIKETALENNREFAKYIEADIIKLDKTYRLSNTEEDIEGFLLAVVQVEQPIMEDLLLKRLGSSLNYKKVSELLKSKFVSHLKNQPRIIKVADYYTSDTGAPINLRVPLNSEIGRSIDQIPIKELANGMIQIIKNDIQVTKEGLFKKMNTILGFAHLGDRTRMRLDEAFRYLEKNQLVVLVNNYYMLKTN
jgi:hypothetical protein